MERSKPCYFFRLPVELRCMVYKELLVGKHRICVSRLCTRSDATGGKTPLRSNNQQEDDKSDSGTDTDTAVEGGEGANDEGGNDQGGEGREGEEEGDLETQKGEQEDEEDLSIGDPCHKFRRSSILYVCRQITSEAIDILYGQNTFKISLHRGGHNDLLETDVHIMQRVRRLHLIAKATSRRECHRMKYQEALETVLQDEEKVPWEPLLQALVHLTVFLHWKAPKRMDSAADDAGPEKEIDWADWVKRFGNLLSWNRGSGDGEWKVVLDNKTNPLFWKKIATAFLEGFYYGDSEEDRTMIEQILAEDVVRS